MTRTGAEERALQIMTGRERHEASEESLHPPKCLRWKDGINAQDHDDPPDLRADVVETAHNDD
jgi:hypothetical protein